MDTVQLEGKVCLKMRKTKKKGLKSPIHVNWTTDANKHGKESKSL